MNPGTLGLNGSPPIQVLMFQRLNPRSPKNRKSDLSRLDGLCEVDTGQSSIILDMEESRDTRDCSRNLFFLFLYLMLVFPNSRATSRHQRQGCLWNSRIWPSLPEKHIQAIRSLFYAFTRCPKFQSLLDPWESSLALSGTHPAILPLLEDDF
uniref:(California timema) hypothetical protein n=1 Tax=Timema californicum TaxID=61474 RepID=A0A7R9J138_TIMCA|nr:unnamed protein product [Timema californicum]